MASKRARRRKECTRKDALPTFAMARAVVRTMLSKKGAVLHPYRCAFGRNHWHVGHPSRRAARRRAA